MVAAGAEEPRGSHGVRGGGQHRSSSDVMYEGTMDVSTEQVYQQVPCDEGTLSFLGDSLEQ